MSKLHKHYSDVKVDKTMSQAAALKIEEYYFKSEAYYEPMGDEIALFEAGPNPGYQSVPKDLKRSKRQRLVALEFDYPNEKAEQAIVAKQAGINAELATKSVKFADMTRNLKGSGLNVLSRSVF